jgi:hypothetical protein
VTDAGAAARGAVAGGTSARTMRLIALLAAIALAPIVLSYAAYRFWPRDARVNYGTLLAPQVLAPSVGERLDGKPFASSELRGRWIVLYAAPGACPGACADALYASRQARTIQNAQRERVVRLWLLADAAMPSAALLAEHPDLVVVRGATPALAQLPQGRDRIYVIDPLGNFVLAWPSRPDIKAMAKDLGRMLRASSIG